MRNDESPNRQPACETAGRDRQPDGASTCSGWAEVITFGEDLLFVHRDGTIAVAHRATGAHDPRNPGHRPTGLAPSTAEVTFLLSDVEGSARLWEHEEAAMRAAIVRHYELLEAAIVLHAGTRPVEQGEGDSVVGAFVDPVDAVAAALDAQRAFAAEPWPGGCDLRIRIAVHTGPAHVLEDGCYFGRAVIRCARLRALAHGGQTVLSAATRDLVERRVGDPITFRDLGSHRLKGLDEPERIWQLCHPDLIDNFAPLSSSNSIAS